MLRKLFICCSLLVQIFAFWHAVSIKHRISSLGTYSVKFISPSGEEKSINIERGVSLLEAAEGADMEAPHSCRTGLCTECAGMIISGLENVHLEAAVLDPEVTAKGFVLTCSASVKGDGVVVELGAGDKMYEAQYGNFRQDHENMQRKGRTLNFLGGLPFGAQESA